MGKIAYTPRPESGAWAFQQFLINHFISTSKWFKDVWIDGSYQGQSNKDRFRNWINIYIVKNNIQFKAGETILVDDEFDAYRQIVNLSTTTENSQESSVQTVHVIPRETVKKIIIDPGHGGDDSGNLGINHNWKTLIIENYAQLNSYYNDGTILKESKITLDYSLILKDQLESKNYIVELTRTTDVPLGRSSRTRTIGNIIGNVSGSNVNTIFISIHTNSVGIINVGDLEGISSKYLLCDGYYCYAYNSAPNINTWVPIPRRAPSGGQVYILSNSAIRHEKSKDLQEKITNNLTDTSIAADNKEAELYVLSASKNVPGVLYEIGFSSNLGDLQYMINPVNQQLICQKLVSSIDAFFVETEQR